jgi:hypothetical protein
MSYLHSYWTMLVSFAFGFVVPRALGADDLLQKRYNQAFEAVADQPGLPCRLQTFLEFLEGRLYVRAIGTRAVRPKWTVARRGIPILDLACNSLDCSC